MSDYDFNSQSAQEIYGMVESTQKINIKVQTNCDGLEREEWPKHLQVLPMIGHKIVSIRGKQATIVAIYHTQSIVVLEVWDKQYCMEA